MALILPQLLLPFLAVLSLNKIIDGTDRNELWKKYKKGLLATAAVFAVLFMIYLTSGFLSNGDDTILKQVRDMNQPQLSQSVNSFYDGLKEDRKGLMMGDILRSFGFILVAVFVLFLFIKNKLNALAATIIITIFAFIDVISIDNKYLNADSYNDKIDSEGVFQLSKADQEILADKSYFRVLNFGGDPFADAVTSYHYNSIGGYHAVKLRIYQDLIERQLRKQQPNFAVLNMLNTKYFIQKDPRSGVTQNYQRNDNAMGPVWFVKHVQFVKNADEEMSALDNFNPSDTAFVQESFRSSIPGLPEADSAASIKMEKNNNDVITYSSVSASNQFAVYSEVYYTKGWKAFIDNKETPIIKTNYALRGLAIPAGNHTIEFRFEPQGYFTGRKITMVASIALLAFLAFSLFIWWRRNKQQIGS
jgi:uncharacterized membrane protein YfhO